MPYRAYIVDLLHQPKKGIFVNLLECLELYLDQRQLSTEFKHRMLSIPSYAGLEKFKRSWFDISKVTASNYRDMVFSVIHGNHLRLTIPSPDR